MSSASRKSGETVLWVVVGLVFVCVLLILTAIHESNRARTQRAENPPPIYHESSVQVAEELEPLPEFRFPENAVRQGQETNVVRLLK